jgi:hypothetical protein
MDQSGYHLVNQWTKWTMFNGYVKLPEGTHSCFGAECSQPNRISHFLHWICRDVPLNFELWRDQGTAEIGICSESSDFSRLVFTVDETGEILALKNFENLFQCTFARLFHTAWEELGSFTPRHVDLKKLQPYHHLAITWQIPKFGEESICNPWWLDPDLGFFYPRFSRTCMSENWAPLNLWDYYSFPY